MKILVVDEEEINRAILDAMLQRLGHTVEQASNCDEALRLCTEHGPYAVVMIGMEFFRSPAGGGSALAEALSSIQQSYALVSGSPIFLQRPCSKEELRDFVNSFEPRKAASSK